MAFVAMSQAAEVVRRQAGGVFCSRRRNTSGAGGRAVRAQAPFARVAACAPHAGVRHIPPPLAHPHQRG